MSALAEKVLGSIRHHRLLEPGDRVLVAVSGGCDSVVLLRLLHELCPAQRWRLEVAHFNHRLRGAEADSDEAWVRELAGRLALPCHPGRGDVRGFAEEQGISIEMAARELRHQFLAKTAREREIRTVALGHHADDQIETFFLRLLRGTSGEGAAGMHWFSPSPADQAIDLVRPLLDCAREDLRQAAQTAGWTWREDATNATGDALRNRLRHELLPLLVANYQPALREVIRRFMEVSGAEAAYAAAAARRWLEGTGEGLPSSDGVGAVTQNPSCSRSTSHRGHSPFVGEQGGMRGGGSGEGEFNELRLAVQRQVLLLQLRQLGIAADFGLVESLLSEPGAKLEVTPGRRVWRDAAGRVIEDAVSKTDFAPGRVIVELRSPAGEVAFAGARIQWAFSERPRGSVGIPPKQPNEEWFDAVALGKRITLRHWQPGDRFQPIGLPQPAKLQDLFVNARVPLHERRRRIVAETEQGVLFWVEGLRIGEVAKVRRDSRRLTRWIWERKEAR